MGAQDGGNNCPPGWVREGCSRKVECSPVSKANRQTTCGHVQRHSSAKNMVPLGSVWVDLRNRCETSSVQSLSCVWLFATPWTEACQASLSITTSRSLLKLMSIELVVPSNHPILCCPLLFLLSIFPSIRAFSNESVLPIRWPEYWSFSFSISPSNKYSGLISLGLTGLIFLQSKGPSRIFSSTTCCVRSARVKEERPRESVHCYDLCCCMAETNATL